MCTAVQLNSSLDCGPIVDRQVSQHLLNFYIAILLARRNVQIILLKIALFTVKLHKFCINFLCIHVACWQQFIENKTVYANCAYLYAVNL